MSQQIYGHSEVLLACLVTVAFDELRRFQFGRSLIHFADAYLWLLDRYIYICIPTRGAKIII